MILIDATQRWQKRFPGGHIGLLVVGNVDNSTPCDLLNREKSRITLRIRKKYSGFDRKDFLNLEVIRAYRQYYKKFKKSYHVQLQIESIVNKGKSLPDVSPLVDANFMADMQSLVLTAGHDADLLVPPVIIDASRGGEPFVQMNGNHITLKPNDMMMTDGKGVGCTIIYGQDNRTLISKKTRRALYVAYAPTGVPMQKVYEQLDLIEKYVICAAPGADIEMRRVFASDH